MPMYAQFENYINFNDVNAPIFSDGSLFWDADLEPIEILFYNYYEYFVVPVPDDPEIPPVNANFAAAPWISGIDEGGLLHVAANTYRQSGNDFWPGPIANDYALPEYTETYDHVWKIEKSTIDSHMANWDMPLYVVPDDIASWPGNGNVANGEAAILAPFYDYNANAVYDPENGDYPIIRGDQAIFFMFNDAADVHTESGGEPLDFEIHGMAYVIDGAADSVLDQALFINYQIINRSPHQYSDLQFALFDDFDLGAFDDDFVGCDSTRNMFYVYNGDMVDGPTSPNYGAFPPALGCAYLNQPLSGFIAFHNSFDSMGSPQTDLDFNNYLHTTWLDGTQLTVGANGYGGITPTNFHYSGDPLTEDGWVESNGLGYSAGDRRGIGITGPYSIDSEDTICIDLVFAYARSYESPAAKSSVGKLKERVDYLQNYYDEHYSTCAITYLRNEDYVPSSVPDDVNFSELLVMPNPSNGFISIQFDAAMATRSKTIEIVNLEGRIVHRFESTAVDHVDLNIMHFAQGLYFIKVSENGRFIRSCDFIEK